MAKAGRDKDIQSEREREIHTVSQSATDTNDLPLLLTRKNAVFVPFMPSTTMLET